MQINLENQIVNSSCPLKCGYVFCGSALPIELLCVPLVYHGRCVVGVRVAITNADGVTVSGVCDRRGASWDVMFAASNFTRYGFVAKGLTVTLVLRLADGQNADAIVGVGDFEVRAAGPESIPGQPGNRYVLKGGEFYFRTDIIDGVQHFVKQEMVYDPDPDIGWGAKWTGDYVLNETGDFVPAN